MMQLTIAQAAPQRRRAARWTIRRRLVCLVTEQLTPGRHRQAAAARKQGGQK